LFEDHVVFVIWNWCWVDDGSCSDEELDDEVLEESQSSEEEHSDDDSIPSITHSVPFKCIGQLKENRYQELLAIASRKLRRGESVPVKLQKEPGNRYDAQAIAFMCKAEQEWERIGYVVKEATSDVHQAMDENKIINVLFHRIKRVVDYKKPGWYAAIIVTRSGEWSQVVQRSRATGFF